MKNPLQELDQIPVTMLVALAYVTAAFLTDPFAPTGEQLHAAGWLSPLLAADGEPWRLLSHAFLHGGLLHLAFNTMMLMSVGPALERSLGSLRFLLLYVVAALGGGIAVCLLYDIRMPIVGGSGALFGMLGALLAINMRAGRHALAFLDYEGPRRLVSMIVANLVIGFLIPFISNTAHIGGLLAGFAVTWLWLWPGRSRSPRLGRWRLATTALFGGLLFASIFPAWRYDYLWNQSQRANKEHRAALQRAAAMAYFGLPQASASDIERFVELELEPATPPPGEPPPRRRR